MITSKVTSATQKRSFPGFDHLYEVWGSLGRRQFAANFGNLDSETSWTDSAAYLRGETTATEPIQIPWVEGARTPSDFVWAQHAPIVHRRVVQLLREHGFTGWRTYSVDVTGKKGESYPDFQGLAIVGRCGAVDLSRSPVVVLQRPGGAPVPHFLGHYFQEDSWDGSDMFMEMPDFTGHWTTHMYVTEGVRLAFKQAKIRNVYFYGPLSKDESATYEYEGMLKHLLPSDLARRVKAAYARAGVPRPD